ncbi:DUF6907 domain-containing protein [Streptomyces sp. NPDC003688]
MSTEPRTVTLVTVDHGDVTLPEPDWCAGHESYVPGHRCDILHVSRDTVLAAGGWRLGHAEIAQAPCAERSSRAVSASVCLDFEPGPDGYTEADLYSLAAAMDAAADQLRALAVRYAVPLANGRLADRQEQNRLVVEYERAAAAFRPLLDALSVEEMNALEDTAPDDEPADTIRTRMASLADWQQQLQTLATAAADMPELRPYLTAEQRLYEIAYARTTASYVHWFFDGWSVLPTAAPTWGEDR